MRKGHWKALTDKYGPAFLALVFLFLSYSVRGQSVYRPSNTGYFTPANKPYGLSTPVPTDGRTYKADSVNGLFRPYNGTAEALTYLPTGSQFRVGQFPIVINVGGSLQSNGLFVGGQIQVWWFLRGQADTNLVRMDSVASGTCPACLLKANNLSDVQSLFQTLINLNLNNVDNTSDATKNSATATLTNKSISGLTNTLTSIPNSALLNNSIGLTIDTAGSSPSVSPTPAALGTSLGLHIPWAGANSGLLKASAYAFFNGKLDSVHVSNDSVYNCVNGNCTLQSVIAGGTGAVLSVSNSDGSLVFSPTTGNVIGSINTAHGNTWTGQQTFNTAAPIFGTLTTNGGVFYGNGSGLLLQSPAGTSGQIFESQGSSGPIFFTPNVTTVNGWLGYTALSNALGSTHIFVGNGSNIATDVPVTGDISFNNAGLATIVRPFVDTIYRTPGKDSLQFTIGGRYHSILDSAGGGGGGAVSSVSNSDGTLTISPTTGAVVASLALGHGNTWITNPQTFNGGLVLGSSVTFGTDNTYSIGSPTAVANGLYTRFLESNNILNLITNGANPIGLSPNSVTKLEVLASGQIQFNGYTTSTSFTGTPTSFAQFDASGNLIQTPIANVQTALSGTGYVKFSGTTPSYLPPTQVTADLNLFTTSLQGLVPGSGGGTTNFLRADGMWAAPPGGGGGADSALWKFDGTYNGNHTLTMGSFTQTVTGNKWLFDSISIHAAGPRRLDSLVVFGHSIPAGYLLPWVNLAYPWKVANKTGTNLANYAVSGTSWQVDFLSKISLIPRHDALHRYFIIDYLANDVANVSNIATWDTVHLNPIAYQIADTMVARGWGAGNEVIIFGLGYMNSSTYPNATAARQLQYNTMAKNLATAFGWRFVNMQAIDSLWGSGGGSSLMSDQVLHPNQWGHDLYADAATKIFTDSVYSEGQPLAIQNVSEFQNIRVRTPDTVALYSFRPVVLDSTGKLAVAPKDLFILNNQPYGVTQSGSIGINGYIYCGLNSPPTAGFNFQSGGAAAANVMSAGGAIPSGITSTSYTNIGFTGGVGYLWSGSPSGSGAGQPLSIAGLPTASTVVLSGTAHRETSCLVEAKGGFTAQSIQVSGSAIFNSTSGPILLLYQTGNQGYVEAYNATTSAGMPLVLNHQGTANIIGGSTTDNGTAFFQLNSNTQAQEAWQYSTTVYTSWKVSSNGSLGMTGTKGLTFPSAMFAAGNTATDSVWGIRHSSSGTDTLVELPYSGGGTSYTFTNGLTNSSGTVSFGGTLSATTGLIGTGQTFTYTAGGTGTFKWSGFSQDSTNTAGVDVVANDSSRRMLPWSKFATKLSQYLPTFNVFPANGLTGAGSDSLYLGGALNQPTTLGTSGFSLKITGLPSSTSEVNILGRAADSSIVSVSMSSGTYSPTLTGTTNITSPTLSTATYTRVGNIVHVTISGSLVATSSLTQSVLTFSLPISRSSSSAIGPVGSGVVAPNSGGSSIYVGGHVELNANTTTGDFNFYYSGVASTGDNFSFSFDYSL